MFGLCCAWPGVVFNLIAVGLHFAQSSFSREELGSFKRNRNVPLPGFHGCKRKNDSHYGWCKAVISETIGSLHLDDWMAFKEILFEFSLSSKLAPNLPYISLNRKPKTDLMNHKTDKAARLVQYMTQYVQGRMTLTWLRMWQSSSCPWDSWRTVTCANLASHEC